MRGALQKWIADADARHLADSLHIESGLALYAEVEQRMLDLFYSLSGELFDYLRQQPESPTNWAALGNAFASLSSELSGRARSDALLFGATAFYQGGYSASALMTMRSTSPSEWDDDIYRSCFDLLVRPFDLTSGRVHMLVEALKDGDAQTIDALTNAAIVEEAQSLQDGPDEWIPRHLIAALLRRFGEVNLRAVLPGGWHPDWNPLVESFLRRRVWEFFPSQIEAIRAGLLFSTDTHSLQMPTGAGKTALTEVLLFSHLNWSRGDKAVLLVPYRALARELRSTVARHLTRLGLPTRTVYGGTVPTREESEDLADVRVIIATPESLLGILGANPDVFAQVSLVVCDEGHLLDGDSRGVGLELLLSRFRSRKPAPRIVFLSAIVPNIEEINSWLGGTDSTVVRSVFRPAPVEYGVLRPVGTGARTTVALEIQAVGAVPEQYALPAFLAVNDFRFLNQETGRVNTYPFNSVKAQAIAAARKALTLGTVAVFAANKTGNQGVIGLVNELLKQIDLSLPLPLPRDHVRFVDEVGQVVEYLALDFGRLWEGTAALDVGVVMHHGDLPQETREVLEGLVQRRAVPMVVCTNTLAEGVNMPIRTMVLYSVRRTGHGGESVPMLARDIKNLVGRAGRAGSTTKGLVICANPNQWENVRPVAFDEPGEHLAGALVSLLRLMQLATARAGRDFDNDDLESTPLVFTLVDGIDAMLLELIADEIGPDEFRAIAVSLAASTFAARQVDEQQNELLRRAFRLRADRILELRSSGTLAWVRDTGVHPRLFEPILRDLAPKLRALLRSDLPLEESLLDILVDWSFAQAGFAETVKRAFRTEEEPDVEVIKRLVSLWMGGSTFREIADSVGVGVNDYLRIHGVLVGHALTSMVEQAIALLQRSATEAGALLPESVTQFPQYLRHGVSTTGALALLTGGVRHRRAAIILDELESNLGTPSTWQDLLTTHESMLVGELGRLVLSRTADDLREDVES